MAAAAAAVGAVSPFPDLVWPWPLPTQTSWHYRQVRLSSLHLNPFLQWLPPPAGGASASIAMSELQGICITACTFDMSDLILVRTLRASNLIENGLSPAACSIVPTIVPGRKGVRIAYISTVYGRRAKD
ncbi:hypothetical protein AB1Y20_007251 [Prymnesium parvum]|uniref:Uncharacterized protein n=1 Tax=Prymnesium parvum TaxID=97485 RepID=A0AB34IUR0_PRYPA